MKSFATIRFRLQPRRRSVVSQVAVFHPLIQAIKSRYGARLERKALMHIYKASIGTFRIRQSDEKHYELSVDDTVLEAYESPRAAADAVYNRQTGYAAWDKIPGGLKPLSIDDWQRADGN